MKIDRSKSRRSSSDVPADCKALISKLNSCNRKQLLHELKQIKSWTCGKCELYHWVDVLDTFDEILAKCCYKQHQNQWNLPCDSPTMDAESKELLMEVMSFTALLIEHSFSRHLYNSMEHLITLLSSTDMQIVLSALGLLFVFSKRSNYIGKLNPDMRNELLTRLSYLAESWGGRENGFGLAECCQDSPITNYPSSATTLHFEYYTDRKTRNLPSSQANNASTHIQGPKNQQTESTSDKKSINVIHIDNVDQIKNKSIATIMEEIVALHDVPRDKQMQLFTHLRLAYCFSNPSTRIQCVQARLQALSIIIYCPSTAQEVNSRLLYSGFIEELVDILQLNGNYIEIKSAALRTLTAIVHLDRNSRLAIIIDATETASYHGFLPVLVRNCIHSLICNDDKFPIPFATSLFSFLYHLASFEKGGEALISCGMMESLLKIISWKCSEVEHITFVTRSVRVIDLITNLDMSVFQAQSGLNIFVERLESEVKICRKDLCEDINDVDMNQGCDLSPGSQPMDVDSPKSPTNPPNTTLNQSQQQAKFLQCYTQRAALLKSVLNFLKKTIQDSTFADCIRHLMDGSLPKSLRHIISNAVYYGPSLFLLSIDLVAVYVFQEPVLLSTLQDSQLTKDILDSILDKPLPPTREVLSALPNIFSALCLNNVGLQEFQARRPFEKIFKVLISPEYLTAMRRRKADLNNDTASNLGNAMDELMRHQPSLRVDVVTAIINLLKELCELGTNPRYTCCTKPSGKPVELIANQAVANQNVNNEADLNFSEDDEEEDEDSASPLENAAATSSAVTRNPVSSFKLPIPLVDYILNVMRFLEAVLTNNSTDDHVKEFLRQDGLKPLLKLMRLKNLPIDFPITTSCGSISAVCRSILTLAREPKVVQEALLSLDSVLDGLQSLHKPLSVPGGSVLLEEFAQVASNHNVVDPILIANLTPLLHSMSATHAYISMFSCLNRSNHLDSRNICVNNWGNDKGLEVLEKLNKLYIALIWESTVLITISQTDISSSTQNKVAATTSNSTHQSSNTYGQTQLERLPARMTNDTEMDDQQNTNGPDTVRFRNSKAMAAQTKLIKPLLVNTSRLVKGLAELFSLHVKLSVGYPVRHRRSNHNIQNTLPIPSSASQNISASISRLLVSGLSWKPSSPLPTPQLR